MNIFVIYQPEAQDARNISEHILDYLVHLYGESHVSGTGRTGDANAHAQALARAQVVIALIGPSWSASADGRVDWELAQALERHKMIVPTLLAGAGLPAPRTPAEAALLTRQTLTVRPEPEMEQDLNRLFGEVNTQLGWAPMSGGLLAAALLLAGLDALFLLLIHADQITLAFDVFNPRQTLDVLLLGVALWQAIRRRTRAWGAIVLVGGLASLAEDVNSVVGLGTVWINAPLLMALPLVTLAFALFGPRRELQRLLPPRIYRLRERIMATQSR